ncbi:hypothetical protein FNF28_01120 [Cafeteria roenbergensis]|uniref:Generative cell specific-1/HAP2 domain-containing protein n=2 Tax=Cafeteria roenbergensis TaxID=33653 RepID=A0A5A8E1Z8_CAFRO|nr:hypothetical protein FNF28_01120 [Cafeteria roenbergensis]
MHSWHPTWNMRSIIAALCVAAAVAVPTFPLDWQAITTDSILLNQGGSVNPDGSVCCSANAPQCKIQTAFQMARQYFAYSKNLTAMKNPDNSGVITDYSVGKEYQVDGQGNCQAYCPLPNRGNELFPFAIDPNATLVGSTQCGAQTCQHWRFVEVIPILNITMEETDSFVATVNGAPAPVYITQHIEPLGEQIGDENQTFSQWQDMDGKTFAPSVFTVVGAASCPMSQQCQGDDDGQNKQDDMPMTENSELFLRFGMNVPGEGRRSVLFSETAVRFEAAQAAAKRTQKLSAALEEQIAMVPAHLQASARAALMARL